MNNPDSEIEEFWMTFKCCLFNFYKYCNINIDITEFSNKLNILQAKRDYTEIEYSIQILTIDLIKLLFNKIRSLKKDSHYIYHFRIIVTNLKRWIKIREKRLFLPDPIETENDYFLLVKLLNSQLKRIERGEDIDDLIYFFEICSKYVHDKDYQFIVDYALEKKQSQMLKIVNNVFDVVHYINEKYDTNFHNNMSTDKIIKKLSKFIK